MQAYVTFDIVKCTPATILVKWKTLAMKSIKISVPFPLQYFDKKATADNVLICGIDEVGRGCLAGPVVVAAAMLKPSVLIETPMPFITDSKKMSSAQRQIAYTWLLENSWYALASVSHRAIDEENIYQATLLAMQRAVAQLMASTAQRPAAIFVDAMPSLCLPDTYLSKAETPENIARLNPDDPFTNPWGKIISFCHGEEQCLAIAAASVIAKVTRDKTMEQLESVFPGYGLAAHKGYATPIHKNALQAKGLSLIHRASFCSFLDQTPNVPQQIDLFPAAHKHTSPPF